MSPGFGEPILIAITFRNAIAIFQLVGGIIITGGERTSSGFGSNNLFISDANWEAHNAIAMLPASPL